MKLKNVFPAFILVFVLGITLTSCEKEDMEEMMSENIVLPSGANALSGTATSSTGDETLEDCFTPVYPVSFTLEDGTTLTVNDNAELEAAILEWEANDIEPEINFPVSVILASDGSQVDVADEDALEEILEDCYGDYEDDDEDDGEEDDEEEDDDEDEDGEDDDCFDDDFELGECFNINYPVNVILEDGTTQTLNSDADVEALMEQDVEAEPVYPFDVTLIEDGSTLTMNDEDDFEDLLDECFEDEYDDEDDFELGECFNINYPVEVELEDGSTQTINSDEDLEALWEQDIDADPVYPFDITLIEDGTTQTIMSEDELEDVLDACFD